MSVFPQVGSTVTNVSTTKTGTAARIDFSDGSSIYVKYDALVISKPDDTVHIRSTTPIVHKSRAETHFESVQKKPVVQHKQRISNAITQSVKHSVPMNGVTESSVTAEQLAAAKLRCENRVNKLSAAWDAQHPDTSDKYMNQ